MCYLYRDLVFSLRAVSKILYFPSAVETLPVCDCHSAYQLVARQEQSWSLDSAVLEGLECRLPGDGATRRLPLAHQEMLQLLNCEGATIQVEAHREPVILDSFRY
jgi:hypothetical protein